MRIAAVRCLTTFCRYFFMNILFQRIKLNQAKTVSIGIPDSASGDTVTYTVVKASDGTSFASGALTFVSGNEWKFSFTPTVLGTYIVEVYDATLNVKFTKAYRAVSGVVEDGITEINESVIVPVGIAESEAADTVTYSIYKISDGSVFASGIATFVSGISWKFSFTPTAADTYAIEVYDSTKDVKYSLSLKAVTSASIAVNAPAAAANTSAEMLALVNSAISARLNGGGVQAYTIQGRNIQYCTLSELWEMRKNLELAISCGNGGARNYASFVDPE